MTFEEFRTVVAKNIEGSEDDHIEYCYEVMKDVTMEGAEMFSVSSTSVHSLYEMYDEEVAVDGMSFDEWWEFEGVGYIRDWVIDMHPGLCPALVIESVDSFFYGGYRTPAQKEVFASRLRWLHGKS